MYLMQGLFVFLFCFVLTPVVKYLAWLIGAVDVPLDGRRMHRHSIPRNGGIAIIVSFLVGLFLLNEWDAYITCFAFGCGFMMLVGLADDIFGLGAWTKLFLQTVTAATAIWGSGIVDGVWLFVALFWVVLLINAHNFIDGLDGLLCGCGSIECLMLGAYFFIAGDGILGITALFLMASCLAFLIYNRYPAHIFAGDCGSEALGFAMGFLSLPIFINQEGIGVLTPIFIFAYPIVDLVSTVARRLLHGYSPFRADRAHLHHRIFAAGLSHPACTNLLSSLCAFFGIIGVLLSIQQLWLIACMACLVGVWFLICVRHYVADAGI